MKISKSWLWALCCSFLLFWSCAEPDPMIDEEALLSADLTLFSDDLKVDDLLQEGAPRKFKKAVGTILQHPWGKKLCQNITKMDVPLIQFEPYLDENGEIVKEPTMLLYAGNGKIYYTGAALNDDYNDELLFHEFFHMYQTGKFVIKCINNEVEAYLAQCFYALSLDRPLWIIDKEFTDMIVELASCVDFYTGYLLPEVTMEQFKEKYNAALGYLRDIFIYNGEGWFENANMDYNNPFPKLMSLIRN